ncbi:MAG TPA: 50S ribosomal protein L11 methyltransferase [Gemmatimonadales bacterium]|jgi:ribosomal protein L11 methyltransferase|nr:50S ribosomal protein L11 methyltransferase [Gemmatimonadales bacterium]
MSWWAIDVRTPAEQRDSMGAWLVAQTGHAVEERDDGTLVAFAPDERSAEVLEAEVGRQADQPVQTQRRPVDGTDWSTRWRDGLGSRRIEQLTVIPSWLPEASDPDPLTIVLDPETAFGSGEHGSTRVALTLLARLLRRGDRVLDLGSGSGILAIAAIKLGAARAIGIDTDPEANEVAARNGFRNGVADRVEFLEGDAGALAALLGPADLLLSNILRSVNTLLLPVILQTLRPRGLAIFSGMEHAEAEEFRRALSDAGFSLEQEALDAGWWGVAAKRPR